MGSVWKRPAKWDHVVRVDGYLIHDIRAALEQLDRAPTSPDAFALLHLLKKCSIARALPETRRLHSHVSRHGRLDRKQALVAHALISTYASLAAVDEARLAFEAMEDDRSVTSWNLLFAAFAQNGQIQTARKVFEAMPSRDSISWNSMIACYSKYSSLADGLELDAATADAWRVFRLMLLDGIPPNELTFVAVVDACSNVEEVDRIHGLVGLETPIAIATSIVTVYGRCGGGERARLVFGRSRHRDVVLWTAMVRALAQCRQLLEMRAVFNRCPLRSIVTWNVVVTGYAQAGQLEEASQLLQLIPEPDTVSWTTLVTAYAQAGQCSHAVKLFCTMDLEGEQPNRVSFLALLDAVAGSMELCKAAHEEIVACRLDGTIAMTTSLIAMYGRCGGVAEARKLFDSMQRRDAAAWNAMMGALVDSGLKVAALALLGEMQQPGAAVPRPGRATLLHALDACSSGDDVEAIRSTSVAQRLLETGDPVLFTALAAAYARVGLVDAAAALFQSAPPGGDGSVVAWCAIVAAYARHGRTGESMAAFSSMQLDGVRPNAVAFLCILSACSHAGMLEEGRCYFQSMASDYGDGEIAVLADHYRCIIDLLGRVGELERAEELLEAMPFEPGGVALTCLATACRMQNESSRGSAAVLRMDKRCRSASPYVLLSSFLRDLGFL